ncbi:MAG: UDP-N-acetylmuramoyl-L-alanyl-D-glutamate--2,6-diaminopimelate ligase [Sedimenticola sp.]
MMAASLMPERITLSALLSGIAEVSEQDDRPVGGVALDSRLVEAGSLFLACSGTVKHGLEFVSQALSTGAVAVVCEPDDEWTAERIVQLSAEVTVPLIQVNGLGRQVSRIAGRYYGHPSRELHLVGITGTNGKTSCSQYLAQAMAPELRCGVIGTLGCGFLEALNPGIHTTPDPVELQSVLAEMKADGAGMVAMEVSSHALDQGRAEDLCFDIAVLTNLSRDHLDYHGSMAGYEAAKRRLFHMPGLGSAVLNMDDPFGRRLAAELSGGVRCIGYALEKMDTSGLDGWVYAERILSDSQGMRIGICSSQGSGELHTSLLGRFNVSNLLAVLAVLLERGVVLDDALARLSGVQTVDGRMEHYGGAGQPLVVVDFAHTPDALKHALEALRPHAGGELKVIFGCGGNRDRGKRAEMGAVAERLADRVWITDDNPRNEDGADIVNDILEGLSDPDAAIVQRDRARAIAEAVGQSGAEDLVLVAGKGHEDYQQVGDLKIPFSDREQVLKALGVDA